MLRPTQVYSHKEPYERAADGQAYQTGFHCQLDVVETPAVRAIFPLLLKPLRALPFAPDDPGFDAASPCGYGGVLLLDNVSAITANQGRELLDARREWCCDNQVISAHVRLHPAFKQEDRFASIMGEGYQLHRAGPTVAIDVCRCHTKTASIANLDKGRRSDLSYARRHLRLSWTSEGRILDEDLQQFRALYELRMTELEAGEYYHSRRNITRRWRKGSGIATTSLFAWLNDNLVGRRCS